MSSTTVDLRTGIVITFNDFKEMTHIELTLPTHLQSDKLTPEMVGIMMAA